MWCVRRVTHRPLRPPLICDDLQRPASNKLVLEKQELQAPHCCARLQALTPRLTDAANLDSVLTFAKPGFSALRMFIPAMWNMLCAPLMSPICSTYDRRAVLAGSLEPPETDQPDQFSA